MRRSRITRVGGLRAEDLRRLRRIMRDYTNEEIDAYIALLEERGDVNLNEILILDDEIQGIIALQANGNCPALRKRACSRSSRTGWSAQRQRGHQASASRRRLTRRHHHADRTCACTRTTRTSTRDDVRRPFTAGSHNSPTSTTNSSTEARPCPQSWLLQMRARRIRLALAQVAHTQHGRRVHADAPRRKAQHHRQHRLQGPDQVFPNATGRDKAKTIKVLTEMFSGTSSRTHSPNCPPTRASTSKASTPNRASSYLTTRT